MPPKRAQKKAKVTAEAEVCAESKSLPSRKRVPPERLGDSIKSSVSEADPDSDYIDGQSHQAGSKRKRGPPKRSAVTTVPKESVVNIQGDITVDDQAYLTTLSRCQVQLANACAKRIKAGQQERDELKSEISRLRDQICKLQDDRGEKLSDIQTRALKHLEDSGADVQSDDSIQATLRQHTSKIKSWAKDYGVEGTVASFDDASKDNIISALVKGRLPATSTDSFKRALEQNVSATTILNAFFTKIISEEIVSQPFFFLKHVRSKELGQTYSCLAEAILGLSKLVDPEKANIWRSHTVGLLQPETTRACTNPEIQRMIRLSKIKQYEICTALILSHPANEKLLKPLTREEEAERYDTTKRIIAGVGDYIVRLASQKVNIEIASLADIRAKGFNNGNPEILAHTSLRIDEESKDHDGNEVLLLVEPLVRAYGNEEGRNYSSYKVWHPAVVIVVREQTNQTTRELEPHPGDRKHSAYPPANSDHNSNKMVSQRSPNSAEASQSGEASFQPNGKLKPTLLSTDPTKRTGLPEHTFFEGVRRSSCSEPHESPERREVPGVEQENDTAAAASTSNTAAPPNARDYRHKTSEKGGRASTPIKIEDTDDTEQSNTITPHQGEQQAS